MSTRAIAAINTDRTAPRLHLRAASSVFCVIERELRAVQPTTHYWPHEERWPPRPLPSQGREGDASNVILTAVGDNLRRVPAWSRDLLTSILIVLWQAGVRSQALKPPS